MALLPENEVERVVYDAIERRIEGALGVESPSPEDRRAIDESVSAFSEVREEILRGLRDLSPREFPGGRAAR